MKNINKRSTCPISLTLEVLGDRWTCLIIRDLLSGKKTYGELLQSEEKISTNILADRLLSMQKSKIIEKKEFPGNKSKNLYQLTQKGIELLPVLLEMTLWGDKYFEVSEKAHEIAEKIRKDRDGLIEKIMKSRYHYS